MPSHITHALFALELKDNPGVPLQECSWYLLGSQGPDMFLHNRRRYPNTVSWGRRIHQEGFGRFVGAMVQYLQEKSLDWDSPPGLYLQGYITHAVLDRMLHPYIHAASYRSKGRHLLLHPFLERLIDVALLQRRGETGLKLKQPFSLNVDLGETIPVQLLEMLTYAAGRFGFSSLEPAEQRIRNAYLDTLGLLRFTDQLEGEQIRWIFQREDPQQRRRILSLFHPKEVPPELDVLNEAHISWTNPWDEQQHSRLGVEDLYEQALEKARGVLQVLIESRSAACDIPALVGNGNLNGSLAEQRPPKQQDSWLVLERAVESRYRELERLSIEGDLVQ